MSGHHPLLPLGKMGNCRSNSGDVLLLDDTQLLAAKEQAATQSPTLLESRQGDIHEALKSSPPRSSQTASVLANEAVLAAYAKGATPFEASSKDSAIADSGQVSRCFQDIESDLVDRTDMPQQTTSNCSSLVSNQPLCMIGHSIRMTNSFLNREAGSDFISADSPSAFCSDGSLLAVPFVSSEMSSILHPINHSIRVTTSFVNSAVATGDEREESEVSLKFGEMMSPVDGIKHSIRMSTAPTESPIPHGLFLERRYEPISPLDTINHSVRVLSGPLNPTSSSHTASQASTC